MPWALIAFPKEYKIAGHLCQVRPSKQAIGLSAYSLLAGKLGAGEIPPVSVVVVFRKQNLESMAKLSKFLREPWEQLKEKDEARMWLLLADDPDEAWLLEHEPHDSELYRACSNNES